MDRKEVAPAGEAEPKFDVVVHMPSLFDLERMRRRAIEEIGYPPEKVEALIKALRSSPSVQLGKEVSKARADKARADLGRLGLEVEVNPVLSLAPLDAPDGRTTCPACGERAVLGPERQCPSCGVYVDKVTPEMLMRKRILEQERGRIAWRLSQQNPDTTVEDNAAMEARLREQIRAELERANGLERTHLRFLNKIGTVPTAALGALMAGLMFGAGWWASGGNGPGQLQISAGGVLAARLAAPMNVEALVAQMEQMPPAAGRAGSGAIGRIDPEASLAEYVRMTRAAGQSPSLDRALAALDATTGAAADAAPRTVGSLPPLPTEARARLLADLSQGLARAGQAQRATEVQATLAAWRSTSDANLAAQLRRSQLMVDAWALQDPAGGAARARLDAIKTGLAAIADPAERAAATGDVAAVLARQPAVPEELAQGYLTQAADAIKTVADPAQRTSATQAWFVDYAAVQLAWLERAARSGQASRVKLLYDQLAAMAAKAPAGATAAHLLALQAQGARLAGRPPAEVSAAAAAALGQVAEGGDLPEQAALLRELQAELPGSEQGLLRSAVQRLADKAEAAPALVRARSLTSLALAAADAGHLELHNQLRGKVLQTAGLSGEQGMQLRADLVVGGELAQARVLYQAGEYLRADQRLQQVAVFLM